MSFPSTVQFSDAHFCSMDTLKSPAAVHTTCSNSIFCLFLLLCRLNFFFYRTYELNGQLGTQKHTLHVHI